MKPNELEILNEGRRELTVQLADGGRAQVTVKKVALVKMRDLQLAGDDFAKLAACYLEADDAPALVATLSDEAILDIVEAGQEINDPLFLRWLRQQERKLEKMGVNKPEMLAAILKAVTENQTASGESSPASSVTATGTKT